MRRSGSVAGVGLLVVLVLIVLLAGQSRSGGPPLDPASSGELGTRALVELVDGFATARVVDGLPTSAHDTALLLTAVDDPAIEDALREWVEAGGRLVVSAEFSAIGADRGGGFSGDLDRGRCDVDALVGVGELELAGGTKLVVGDDDRSCFGDGRQAFVVVEDLGAGSVTTVGSTTPFVNRYLDEADNSVLAVALLGPAPEVTAALIRPESGLEGEQGSLELLGPAFDRSVWQAIVAFTLFAIATAVRFGRPVTEAMPARIAGSELVSAVGGLMSDADEPDQAAAVLRADARQELCRLCSIDVGVPDETLAGLLAARTGWEAETVRSALAGRVDSAGALLTLTRTLDHLQAACRQVPGGTP